MLLYNTYDKNIKNENFILFELNKNNFQKYVGGSVVWVRGNLKHVVYAL